MSFEQYRFKEFIYKALNDLKFQKPTPIQEEVIPLILNNKSVIGQSETGSGKTHAFLLPLFNKIEPSINKVQLVVTSPTRELAKQLYDVASQISGFSDVPFKIRLYVGGKDRERELEWLNHNQPDIVIGTPGRVWDLAIKERKLLVHQAKYFIVDEADMTLDTGFLKEIDSIASTMVKDLQMCVFSATIPEQLKPFLRKYMENPESVNLTKFNATPVKLEHFLIKTKYKDKYNLLLKVMSSINPYLCFIFANTKKEVIDIANFLRSSNYQVGEIHGDLESRERAKMMRDVRELKYTYVVATDIASRGIDIEGISHIINFSLPADSGFYIHRAGRTSRKNTTGIVISLYDLDDDTYLQKLENKNIKFEYKEIKDNQFVEAKDRNFRKKYVKEIDNKKKVIVTKPKKVSPNYKKKMKEQVDIQKKSYEPRKYKK
ncbi:MAG: box helicase [Haloplasmataceae bacterium]|jgi:ATP-dependent RNA helicase CshB|nr:box helicase [Haloplasmataceae bacterium]